MPQWAGSCWYYLRYLDPTNDDRPRRPRARAVLDGSATPVASTSTSAVPSTRCCTCSIARFWHKVLYDLGHVSTPEPFHRLYNQGTLTAFEYIDERGMYVEAKDVEERDGTFLYDGREVSRRSGRMGKSRKNMVTPDEIYRDYGADTLRLYEMFMGPLDADRVWSTADIAGVYRFLQRFWRNVVDEDTGELHVVVRRRRRRHAEVVAPHDRGGARRHGHARVQHRDRPAVRVEQPPHAGGGQAGQRTGRSGARHGADARSAHAACRRGAVGEARSRRRRSRSSRSPCPIPRCSSTTKSRSPCRSTARCAPASRVASGADDIAARSRGACRRDDRRAARRCLGAQGRGRARPARELRHRLGQPEPNHPSTRRARLVGSPRRASVRRLPPLTSSGLTAPPGGEDRGRRARSSGTGRSTTPHAAAAHATAPNRSASPARSHRDAFAVRPRGIVERMLDRAPRLAMRTPGSVSWC